MDSSTREAWKGVAVRLADQIKKLARMMWLQLGKDQVNWRNMGRYLLYSRVRQADDDDKCSNM